MLSPQAAAPSANRTMPNSAQRGSRNISTHSSGERNATAPATPTNDPLSAKAKLMTQAKKNATITEEDDEEESNYEIWLFHFISSTKYDFKFKIKWN